MWASDEAALAVPKWRLAIVAPGTGNVHTVTILGPVFGDIDPNQIIYGLTRARSDDRAVCGGAGDERQQHEFAHHH